MEITRKKMFCSWFSGKRAVLECNAQIHLLDKLFSMNESVVRHATTCIANVLEDPQAKTMFRENGTADIFNRLNQSGSDKPQKR